MRNAEFQVVVAACGVSIDGRTIGPRLPDIRWHRFLRLVDRHRVQALCWQGLKSGASDLPLEVAAILEAKAREIIAANLRAMAECHRLNVGFRNAGIPLLFLKGLTLGRLAYRTPALKMSMDIDLLVGPDRLGDAAHALRDAGYLPTIPKGAGEARLIGWHAANKESVWYRPKGQFQLDLHSRLADQDSMLPGMGVGSPRQQVEVCAGISLPTLADDELFAYLCVHGASSAWFRLKWITDFSALLNDKSPAEIERLYARSQELGAGRAAAQALLLADRIYATRIGAGLRDRLAADRTNRQLVRMAENQLLNPVEPTERFLGTATIHLSQLGLLPGWKFKLFEIARQTGNFLGVGAK